MALFLSESSAKSATIADLIGEKIDSLIITTPPVKVILHSKEEDKKEGKAFSFETIPASKEIVDTILSYADKGIFIAFDPDQRGEYMTWLISEFIKTHCHMSTRPKRIHLDCLTMEGLRESVKSPVENHYENGFAFYVRSLFDRLLVDNIERITGKREGPSGLPYNFQTLTFLFFLNEREDEIENFSPSNKWQIRATVNSIKGEFEAKLETMGDITQDGVLKNKEEVEKALKYVAEKEFLVKSVSRVSKKIDTPSPFDTVNLVQEAFLQLKFNPEKTLKLSQELFHGTNINGNNHGIISSFITNEVDLPEERAQTLKEYILQTHGENVLGSYTVSYEGERIPVIPLLPEITPDQIAKALSQEAGNLYQLIRNRAFASQMKEAYGENVEVIIQVGDECTFSAFKTCITEKGYLDIYQNMEEKDLLVQEPISTLCEGQTLNLVNTYAEPSSGVPPEYYTLEAIFSDLAEMGISMDFLMAASLKELIQKDYIEITSRGVIRPRENCSKVVQLIDHAFPTMSGLNLSAYFSQTVDEVVSGRKDLNEALSQFSQTLTMHVNKTSKAGDSIPRRGETEAAQKQAMKTQVQEKGRVESILRGVPRGERRRDTATVIKSHMVEKNSSLEKLVFDDLGTDRKSPEKHEKPVIEETLGKIDDKTVVPCQGEVEKSGEVKREQIPQEAKLLKDAREIGETSISEKSDMQNEGQILEEKDVLHARISETEESSAFETPDEIREKGNDNNAESLSEVKTSKEAITSTEEDTELSKILEPEAMGESIVGTDEHEEEKLSPKDEDEKYCPDCSRLMRLREDKYGKFWECLGFPECRHTESFDKLDLKMICPICRNGEVIIKRTQIGTRFYVCSNKGCEFITWHLPYAVPCPECNNPFLVEKKDRKGKSIIKCPRAGCHYQRYSTGKVTPVSSSETSTQKTKKVRKVRVKTKSGSGKSTGKIVRKVVRVKSR